MHSSLFAVFTQEPPRLNYSGYGGAGCSREREQRAPSPPASHGGRECASYEQGPGVGWRWPGQRPVRESSPRASLSWRGLKRPNAGSELRCQEGEMREQSLVGKHLLPLMGGVSSSACHAQRWIWRAWAGPRSMGTRPLTERTWEGKVFAARKGCRTFQPFCPAGHRAQDCSQHTDVRSVCSGHIPTGSQGQLSSWALALHFSSCRSPQKGFGVLY